MLTFLRGTSGHACWIQSTSIRFLWTILPTAAFLFSAAGIQADTLEVPEAYSNIQSAIDAAQPGDTVAVSAGTYTGSLRMKPGVAVKSKGDNTPGQRGLLRAEKTIIRGDGKEAKVAAVVMAEGSTLDGFTVTGVGIYDEDLWNRHHQSQGEEQSEEPIGAPGIAGIEVQAVSFCTVSNNIVHHIGYTGIAISGTKEMHVAPRIFRNVCFRNMGGGIGSMQGSHGLIEENTCFENFYAGIGHDNASPLVLNNTCYGNIRAGIGVSEGACPTVRGNRCYKNRRAGIGIRTLSSTAPLVERNECFENEMAGIGSRDDATPILRNNRCYRNAMAGIGCQSRSRPVIEGNECFENRSSGIGCRTESAPVIRRNRCYDNAASGIGSQQGARPIVVDNQCYNNRLAGIGTEDQAHALIQDNECKNNGQAGIGTRNGAHAVIVGNECRGNSTVGIGIEEKATAILIANQSVDNQQVSVGIRTGSTAFLQENQLVRSGGMPPLIAIRENSKAVVLDNELKGGGVAGILLDGTALIANNHLWGEGPRAVGPPNFGVWVQEGSKANVDSNRIHGWRHGLFALKSQQVTVLGNNVSEFHKTAIVVQDSTLPTHVFGNTAVSEDEKAAAMRITGPQGTVSENLLKQTASKE